MEKTETPIGHDAITKDLEQRRFDVAAQIMRQHADDHSYLQRNVGRGTHREVMAHPAITVEMMFDRVQQFAACLFGSSRIDGDSGLIPTAGPTQVGSSYLVLTPGKSS